MARCDRAIAVPKPPPKTKNKGAAPLISLGENMTSWPIQVSINMTNLAPVNSIVNCNNTPASLSSRKMRGKGHVFSTQSQFKLLFSTIKEQIPTQPIEKNTSLLHLNNKLNYLLL